MRWIVGMKALLVLSCRTEALGSIPSTCGCSAIVTSTEDCTALKLAAPAGGKWK